MSITNEEFQLTARQRRGDRAVDRRPARRRNVVFERPPTSAARNAGLLLGSRQGDLSRRRFSEDQREPTAHPGHRKRVHRPRTCVGHRDLGRTDAGVHRTGRHLGSRCARQPGEPDAIPKTGLHIAQPGQRLGDPVHRRPAQGRGSGQGSEHPAGIRLSCGRDRSAGRLEESERRNPGPGFGARTAPGRDAAARRSNEHLRLRPAARTMPPPRRKK